MQIRQSDLAAYQRCPRQKKYRDLSRQGEGPTPSSLSRTVYGSVMHHAVRTLEELHSEHDDTALETALATFAHYWHPDNVSELPDVQPVTDWLVRDTYGGMRTDGLQALRDYYALLVSDPGMLLALEYNFHVPLDLGDVGQHVLVGTVDRLTVRKTRNQTYLSVEDFKTGNQPRYLRYNVQFTTYCWASTQRAFWDGFGDLADARWQKLEPVARRGRWIDLKKVKYVDAGWRGNQDYLRLMAALREYVRACNADIYPLTLSGEACMYCDWRNSCAGIPVPDESEGAP
jgi:hypothetical protein